MRRSPPLVTAVAGQVLGDRRLTGIEGVHLGDTESDHRRWRNDGIAQNPQAWSQPSATFTYAQGTSEAAQQAWARSNAGTSAIPA